MDLGLKNRVAIVTGGARGIGRAISRALAEEGAIALVADKDLAPAEALADEIKASGGTALAVQLDVTDRESIANLVATAKSQFGRIDVLVNNAGYTLNKPFLEMSPERWDEVIDVCLTGVYRMTHAVLPEMIDGKFGRVINIASRAVTGTLHGTNYSAAKAGVVGFTKALAMEVGAHGITVNAVSPGLIRTERVMQHAYFAELDARWRAQSLVPRGGEPEDIAHAVLYLASVNSGFVTAENIHVTGGLF